MIICPNCKEEIEDDSCFCDQCGQSLSFCEKCGRVGMGRRCTSCGGLMVPAEEYHRRMTSNAAVSSSVSTGFASQEFIHTNMNPRAQSNQAPMMAQSMPQLLLYNDSLNIRMLGINGAVIGRRQGPYAQNFAQNMYVSSVHAQLKYKPETGWCVADKHSSNGTKLNDHSLQPDVEMSLKNGDILTIANINLQVSVS